MIIGIGNVYLETDLFGVDTKGSNHLEPEISYSSTSYQTYIGGSTTNFIKQLKKLGNEVVLLAKIGRDETGQEVKKLLKADDISTELLVESEDVQTSIVVATILSHNGQHIPTTGGNANQKLEISDIHFDHPLFKQASSIFLSAYFKQSKLRKIIL